MWTPVFPFLFLYLEEVIWSVSRSKTVDPYSLLSIFYFHPKNFDQNKLEEEMRKRKERVEKWREEQRKKAMENIGELKKEIEEMKQGKKWSLEDDDGTFICLLIA